MFRELTFEEVEALGNTGEWPMLATTVASRKYEPAYMSGKRKTTFQAIEDSDNHVMAVFGYEPVHTKQGGLGLYIGPLCVHERYRGKGIGSLVVTLLQTGAIKSGTKLVLYAHKDVQGFYEKHGFKAMYEVEENYQAMEWEPDEKETTDVSNDEL